jgi:RND family efflux transporter MFP subunit
VNIRVSSIFLSFAIAFLACSQWDCNKNSNSESQNSAAASAIEEMAVKTAPVIRGEWIAAASISGDLRTLSTVEVKTEVGGKLIDIRFQEGDFIKKDQLIAEIDPVNYKLSYDQAAAVLAVAQAGLDHAQVAAEHARTEKERADNLLRSGGITQKDHQAATTGIKEAESQVRLAEAQCGQAKAALAIAEKALRDCKIYAPAQGHVQKKYFDRGSLLSPGVSICSLVDNSQLELECVIPSYQLAAIKMGQRASFTTPTWANRRFEGIVSAIIPEIESDNRSVKLRLSISNPSGELRSGMYARGEIITGRQPNALIIPRDSLIPEKSGSGTAGVFVIRGGKAQRVDIQIGDSQEEQVWVKHGLSEGDLVIVEIGPSLKEGSPVRAAK